MCSRKSRGSTPTSTWVPLPWTVDPLGPSPTPMSPQKNPRSTIPPCALQLTTWSYSSVRSKHTCRQDSDNILNLKTQGEPPQSEAGPVTVALGPRRTPALRRTAEENSCVKAPGFGRDSWTLQTRGKLLSATLLPALSMTRAQAAHGHFRMQGQKRAERKTQKRWEAGHRA